MKNTNNKTIQLGLRIPTEDYIDLTLKAEKEGLRTNDKIRQLIKLYNKSTHKNEEAK